MSIQTSEIIWRRPTEVSDAPTNGGRMGSVSIISGVKNSLFPSASQAERTAGSTKYRKAFAHIANDDTLALLEGKVFLTRPTPGDDRVTIFPGTQLDTQASITGAEGQYGIGTLNANANIGQTTMAVLVENAADNIFRTGMVVRVSDRQTIDGAGNEQFLTLSGNATYVGNVATLTFTTTPLQFNFLAATPTYVSSCITDAVVEAEVVDYAEVTGTGTYDELGSPIQPHGIGSIEQLWTLTFTSSTVFTIVGDTVGSLGTGNVSTNTVPSNPAYSKPYFTLLSAGFGGSWAPGNTIQFRTHPAAIPVWHKRVIPAAANSLSANFTRVGVDGESE